MQITYAIREVRAIADLVSHEGMWVITRINVPAEYRGKGYGTQLLRRICADADREGATLTLTIHASGALEHAALEAWYTRHGFKVMPEGWLERKPNPQ